MFCARCGHQVSADDRVCPSCQAELWRSGALRLTSPNEPAHTLDDIFPELSSTPAQAVAGSTASTGHALGTRLTTRGIAVVAAFAVLLVVLLVALLG